ncbi:hypothetical protein GUJ93_ZPchr0009g1852 [Zizania palustris]|uniref:Uncharacterized protein n=1 Tax=Zizania palustris TaxID=103762 RepID=A0A8J5RSJ1_ZIZPA|nr:hypothetical protein GUJ93_ZPchr0009g1852 [Zizania palustris]
MKGLFNSKLRMPADVLRQTRELLVFLSPTLRQFCFLAKFLPHCPHALAALCAPADQKEALKQPSRSTPIGTATVQKHSSSPLPVVEAPPLERSSA